MRDETWVLIRACLMIGCGFLSGRGFATMDQLTSIVDQIPLLVTAVIAIGSGGWAMWVRWRTRAVPIETAKRDDVPTINPATGAREPGPAVT